MKKASKKLQLDKLDLQSMSITEDQKRKLRQLFPEIFVEKKIDWKKLKATLGEEIESHPELYNINWAGRANCFRVIQETSLGTLKPCKKESLDWENTKNLFIEGDNLEVLKLLQRSYYGKVKMIYIDPPYNTGKDFIYPDKYKEQLETYLQYTGQKDSEGKSFSTNQETDGRFHSNWLNMMYPRLFLARNLLREDGVIFISIDDNEVANLRKICDEIFGEENFIGAFIINSTPNGRDYGHIAKTHEFCLFYAKDIDQCQTNRLPTERKFNYYDDKGGFNIHPLYNSNEFYHKKNRPNLYYPFFLYKNKPLKELGSNFYKIGLEKKSSSIEIYPPLSSKNKIPFVWRWGKEKSIQNLNQEIIGYKTSKNNYRIVQKMRTDEKLIRSIIYDKDCTSRKGTAEAEELLTGKFFQFPKPVSLIKNFLQSGMNKNDIILDFFAGSGTTAHAVYEKNLEDGGNRRYICVQLPEPIKETEFAFKEGYKTIADIGKERIRRAIKKIKEEEINSLSNREKIKQKNQQTTLFSDNDKTKNNSKKSTDPQNEEKENQSALDLGFRVFKLDRTNFKIWDDQISKDKKSEKQITFHLDNLIDKKSSKDDLLYEILINTGFELTTEVLKLNLAGKTVYSVEKDALLICLEEQITKELIIAIAERSPARVICLDKGFEGNDHLKTNAKETFRDFEVRDFKTI